MTTTWGLLGPETLASERRTRTLGLGSTVRSFNDLAVPGLGGVWFGKQLFLATLGIATAERVRNSGKRVQNIEVANAVEALACWSALNDNNWNGDPRVRGATKMRGKTDLAYSSVRKRSFYVTQPMRQATIQPLLALGLVESTDERFNAFTCSPVGHDFINEVCQGFNPYNSRSVMDHLVGWVKGKHAKVRSSELTGALSPIKSMSESGRHFLRERIVSGTGVEKSRRQNSLCWVKSLDDQLQSMTSQPKISWDRKPAKLDESHWSDLHAGALFFMARDAAIDLLDQIEAHLGNQSEESLSLDKPLPKVVTQFCDTLRKCSNAFLELACDPTHGNSAAKFCRECTANSDVQVIERLLAREGRVLRLRGREVIPGAAFRGGQVVASEKARSDEEGGQETDADDSVQLPDLPDGISRRVYNLIWLNRDLRGQLGDWFGDADEKDEYDGPA